MEGWDEPVPRAERVAVNREFASVEQFIAEYVTNVSSTGVFIKTRNPLPVGTVVDLRFTIIIEDPEFIEGVGEVVRQSEHPSGMGVVFTELSPVSQRLIAELLTRRAGT